MSPGEPSTPRHPLARSRSRFPGCQPGFSALPAPSGFWGLPHFSLPLCSAMLASPKSGAGKRKRGDEAYRDAGMGGSLALLRFLSFLTPLLGKMSPHLPASSEIRALVCATDSLFGEIYSVLLFNVLCELNRAMVCVRLADNANAAVVL